MRNTTSDAMLQVKPQAADPTRNRLDPATKLGRTLTKAKGSQRLLGPAPAVCEGRHRGRARLSVAVGCAMTLATVASYPHPRAALGCSRDHKNAADDYTALQHVVIVVGPRPAGPRRVRAFEDQRRHHHGRHG